MSAYALLLSLHIVLVGTWLGTDVGTMLAFRRMTSPALPVTTRIEMGRLADLLDMGPRSALILLLILGAVMTDMGGFASAGGLGAVISVVAAAGGLLWLVGVWHQFWVSHASPEKPRAAGHLRFQRWFRSTDLWWRAVLAAGLVLDAGVSLAGGGPVRARWLAVKLILFAGILGLGFAIRTVLPGVGTALGAIVAGGSTPDREAALAGAARPAYPLVWAIWALILGIAWLSVAKPL